MRVVPLLIMQILPLLLPGIYNDDDMADIIRINYEDVQYSKNKFEIVRLLHDLSCTERNVVLSKEEQLDPESDYCRNIQSLIDEYEITCEDSQKLIDYYQDVYCKEKTDKEREEKRKEYGEDYHSDDSNNYCKEYFYPFVDDEEITDTYLQIYEYNILNDRYEGCMDFSEDMMSPYIDVFSECSATLQNIEFLHDELVARTPGEILNLAYRFYDYMNADSDEVSGGRDWGYLNSDTFWDSTYSKEYSEQSYRRLVKYSMRVSPVESGFIWLHYNMPVDDDGILMPLIKESDTNAQASFILAALYYMNDKRDVGHKYLNHALDIADKSMVIDFVKVSDDILSYATKYPGKTQNFASFCSDIKTYEKNKLYNGILINDLKYEKYIVTNRWYPVLGYRDVDPWLIVAESITMMPVGENPDYNWVTESCLILNDYNNYQNEPEFVDDEDSDYIDNTLSSFAQICPWKILEGQILHGHIPTSDEFDKMNLLQKDPEGRYLSEFVIDMLERKDLSDEMLSFVYDVIDKEPTGEAAWLAVEANWLVPKRVFMSVEKRKELIKSAANKGEIHAKQLLDKEIGYICEPYLAPDDKPLDWNKNWSLYRQLTAFESVFDGDCSDKVQRQYEYNGCGVPDWEEEQKYVNSMIEELCCKSPLYYNFRYIKDKDFDFYYDYKYSRFDFPEDFFKRRQRIIEDFRVLRQTKWSDIEPKLPVPVYKKSSDEFDVDDFGAMNKMICNVYEEKEPVKLMFCSKQEKNRIYKDYDPEDDSETYKELSEGFYVDDNEDKCPGKKADKVYLVLESPVDQNIRIYEIASDIDLGFVLGECDSLINNRSLKLVEVIPDDTFLDTTGLYVRTKWETRKFTEHDGHSSVERNDIYTTWLFAGDKQRLVTHWNDIKYSYSHKEKDSIDVDVSESYSETYMYYESGTFKEVSSKTAYNQKDLEEFF